jgi:hypothetical protein
MYNDALRNIHAGSEAKMAENAHGYCVKTLSINPKTI